MILEGGVDMLIQVTEDNIDEEHICCAISEKKGENCVGSKKAWMKQQFEDGLVFTKLNERGKVFIEYIPAQKAWIPIDAKEFMHINCLWVSGKFKGQGYSSELLDSCIKDAKEKGYKGLTALGSKKKKHFLADPKHLKYKGFQIANTIAYDYELLYLPFEDDISIPSFNDCVRECVIEEQGYVLYYTNQCPHTDKYVPILEAAIKEAGEAIKIIKIESLQDAKACPAPFTTYSLFYNGQLYTNEILGPSKIVKMLKAHE